MAMFKKNKPTYTALAESTASCMVQKAVKRGNFILIAAAPAGAMTQTKRQAYVNEAPGCFLDAASAFANYSCQND